MNIHVYTRKNTSIVLLVVVVAVVVVVVVVILCRTNKGTSIAAMHTPRIIGTSRIRSKQAGEYRQETSSKHLS